MGTPLFGIHLGNSSGCVGVFKDGNAQVLANDSGDRITPAVVSYRGAEIVLGAAAKAGFARFSACTIKGNKRLMKVMLSEDEIKGAISQSACKIIHCEGNAEDDNIKYAVDYEGDITHLTPDQVAIQLYRKLHETAQSSLHISESILPAVLSVPAHFCSTSRQEVIRAAQGAGFKVLQLIDEPSAAMFAHGVGSDLAEEGIVVVYRVGGVSMDVTVFKVNSGMYTHLKNVHNHKLGGQHFTAALAKFLAGEFYQKVKIDPAENRRSMAKLQGAAELCKHVLSTMNTAHCFVESLVDGVDLSSYVSRARFDSLITPLLPEFLDPVTRALESCGLSTRDVNKVVLSGGSLKIPRLQQAVSGLLPDAEVLGSGPALSPDEVIALGAAQQAGCLPANWVADIAELSADVQALAKGLFYKTDGDDGLQLLARAECPVPLRISFKKSVPKGNNSFSVKVLEGNSAEEARAFGKIALDDVREGSIITVEIEVNREGKMRATLADMKSDRKICSSLKEIAV